MRKIKTIRVKASLKTKGVFNFNDSIKGDFPMLHAKKFYIPGVGENDRKEVRDFTSSNCLRHHIFKDGVGTQSTDLKKDNYLEKLAGSIAGIVRGYMAIGVNASIKRASPLFVSDAISRESVLFQEFLTAPRSDGDSDKPTTSSVRKADNAPTRYQDYEVALNIKLLQFLRQDGIHQNSVNITEKSEKLWVECLKKSFEAIGVSSDLEIKGNHVDKNDICPYPIRGIKLNNEQLRATVLYAIESALNISAFKSRASIQTERESIEAQLVLDNGEILNVGGYDNLIKAIKEMDFEDFYKEGTEEAPALAELIELDKKRSLNTQLKKDKRKEEAQEKEAKKKAKKAS